MIEEYLKKGLMLSIFVGLCSNFKGAYGFEDSYFNNNFNLFNYFNHNHIKIVDLKINERYLFNNPYKINIDLALSALKGIERDNKYKKVIESEKNVVINQWNKITKNNFFNKNLDENLIKGIPEPYSINNITDHIKNIKLFFNNDEMENKEIIYNGKYIPKIYNSIFLILLISFMYLFCIKILFQGYHNGKNVAKKYIPRISTLLVFFTILKSLLAFFGPVLCVFICIILTSYFYSVSMSACENIYFLRNSKIKKEPIGWILIVFSQSILIGNIFYHLLFTVDTLHLLIKYIKNSYLLHAICILVLLLITSLIFILMISNILPAKRAQNFVFSFTTSYLIVSCCTYFYNLFILRFLNNTHIFQIEPIMFFSYTPKFVFNTHNAAALLILFIMTILSLSLPKWLKQNNTIGKGKSNMDNTTSNKYTFLNHFA